MLGQRHRGRSDAVGKQSYEAPEAVRDPNDPNDCLVNVTGVLVMMLATDLSEQFRTKEARARLRRYQERARAALEMESLSLQPRDVGQVLWAAFRGEELSRRLAADGYRSALDWLLDECAHSLS
jgi:hypothetical protein